MAMASAAPQYSYSQPSFSSAPSPSGKLDQSRMVIAKGLSVFSVQCPSMWFRKCNVSSGLTYGILFFQCSFQPFPGITSTSQFIFCASCQLWNTIGILLSPSNHIFATRRNLFRSSCHSRRLLSTSSGVFRPSSSVPTIGFGAKAHLCSRTTTRSWGNYFHTQHSSTAATEALQNHLHQGPIGTIVQNSIAAATNIERREDFGLCVGQETRSTRRNSIATNRSNSTKQTRSLLYQIQDPKGAECSTTAANYRSKQPSFCASTSYIVSSNSPTNFRTHLPVIIIDRYRSICIVSPSPQRQQQW